MNLAQIQQLTQNSADVGFLLTRQKIREGFPLFAELEKLSVKYANALREASQLGAQMAQMVSKIAIHCEGDIGDGIQQYAELRSLAETKHMELANAVVRDFIEPMKKYSADSAKELAVGFFRFILQEFQKSYKKDRELSAKEIQKLESTTRKLGGNKKTSVEQLKAATQALKEAVENGETLQMNKLKEITLQHRRKYCGFLAQLCRLATVDKALYETVGPKMAQYFPEMQHTSGTAMLVPEDFQAYISRPMRSFIQIDASFADGGGGGGSLPPDARYSEGYVPEPAYEDPYPPAASSFDERQLRKYSAPPPPVPGWGSPPPPPAWSAAPPPPPPAESGGGGLTAVALYDYSSEEPSDLNFAANDIITVLQQDDDDSGWWEGELNGRQGLFPKSYVTLQ